MPGGKRATICTSPWDSSFKLLLSPAMDLLWLSVAHLSTISCRRISRAFQVELWTSALITDFFFRIVKNCITKKYDIVEIRLDWWCTLAQIRNQWITLNKLHKMFYFPLFFICHFLWIKQMWDTVCNMFHHIHSA